MEILVTGGTGFLGQHLASTLLSRGHRVHLLGRNFTRVQRLITEGALPVVADLRDHPAVIAACKGIDIVYHMGGLSAPWGKRDDFYDINVGGTEAVIAGCRTHDIQRLIYVSSPSVVFDGHDQHHIPEDIPYPRRFLSAYGLTKKLGEDLVNMAATHLETVILRPKAMFGPGDQTLLPRLITAARQNRLLQIGDGRNFVDLTYVENVVYALVLALNAQAAAGKTYTITNNEHVLLWDIIRMILQRLELPTNLRKASLSIVLAAAFLMEILAAITGKEPLLTRYSTALLARTQTYDISAAQHDLGYTPPISVAEGIERTIERLKAENLGQILAHHL